MTKLWLAVVVFFTVPFAHGAWINEADYGNLHIVVAQDASDEDRLAAEAFAEYWRLATGHDVPVADTPGDGVNIWIGLHGAPQHLRDRVDLNALVPDGVRIFTAGPSDLVIAGAGPGGALNGVYEFFERYIGVRWLAPGATFVPAPSGAARPETPAPWERFTPESLPEMDFSHVPVFEYRWTRHNRAQTAEFAQHHRLTQSPGFGLFVHTLYQLLPPDVYFEQHPEYYSEVNGERVAPLGLSSHDYWADADLRRDHGHRFAQLCVTNPDVVAEVTNNLLKMMRENPTPRIWSVSQEDWGGYCECAICAEQTRAEGTPMGPLLRFVNQVAVNIETEFPEHFVETLAYTWSRQVPKTVRPRKNVIIRLCSIECDFARPLNDPAAPENVRFAQDIRDWAEVAHQLYIWDYTVNFRHYHLPHPNLNVLHENIRIFADNKVRGVFEQGLGAPEVELGYIRPYLLSRLLWNPDLDYDAVKEEFIDLFFQEAAPHYRGYLDLIHRTVQEKDWMMDTFDMGGWIDKTVVEEARACLSRALAAAQSDAVRERVRYEQLSVEYAALVAAPTLSLEEDAFVLEWPESLSVEDYIALAQGFGVPEYAERMALETLGKTVKTRDSQRRAAPITRIENDHHLLWITPDLQGSVIRWHDKKRDREWLLGYRYYGARPGTWQDWHNMPLTPESPAADAYEVIEQSDTHLVIEGIREDGLRIRRTMRLESDSDRVHVRLDLQNPTDAPLAPTVKMHPEFYSQSGHVPEIWGRWTNGWKRMDNNVDVAERPADGQILPAADLSAMAFFSGSEGVGLACEFGPEAPAAILWFYASHVNHQQVNLELLPPGAPLPPGGSCSVEGFYYVIDAPPPAL